MKIKNLAGRVLAIIIASMLLLSLVSCATSPEATSPETTPPDNCSDEVNYLRFDVCEDYYHLRFDYENDRPVFNLKLNSYNKPYDYAIITFAKTENMVLENEEPIKIDYIEDSETIPIYFNITTPPFEGIQLDRSKIKLDYAGVRMRITAYKNDREVDHITVRFCALATPEGIFVAPEGQDVCYWAYIYYLYENGIITEKEYNRAVVNIQLKPGEPMRELIECGKSADELDSNVEVNLESDIKNELDLCHSNGI